MSSLVRFFSPSVALCVAHLPFRLTSPPSASTSGPASSLSGGGGDDTTPTPPRTTAHGDSGDDPWRGSRAARTSERRQRRWRVRVRLERRCARGTRAHVPRRASAAPPCSLLRGTGRTDSASRHRQKRGRPTGESARARGQDAPRCLFLHFLFRLCSLTRVQPSYCARRRTSTRRLRALDVSRQQMNVRCRAEARNGAAGLPRGARAHLNASLGQPSSALPVNQGREGEEAGHWITG